MKFIQHISIVMTIVLSIGVCLHANGKGGSGGKGGGRNSGQGHGRVHQGIPNKEIPNRRSEAGSHKSSQSDNTLPKKAKPPMEAKSSKTSNSSPNRGAKKPDKPEKASKPEKSANQGDNKRRGQGHTQQLKALQQQLSHEETKHLRRHARLARIRELAVAKGDTKIIARVDQLITKEGQRFEHKWQRMEKRQTEINGLVKIDSQAVTTEVPSVPKPSTEKKHMKTPGIHKPDID